MMNHDGKRSTPSITEGDMGQDPPTGVNFPDHILQSLSVDQLGKLHKFTVDTRQNLLPGLNVASSFLLWVLRSNTWNDDVRDWVKGEHGEKTGQVLINHIKDDTDVASLTLHLVAALFLQRKRCSDGDREEDNPHDYSGLEGLDAFLHGERHSCRLMEQVIGALNEALKRHGFSYLCRFVARLLVASQLLPWETPSPACVEYMVRRLTQGMTHYEAYAQITKHGSSWGL
jgi:hypothetical protein